MKNIYTICTIIFLITSLTYSQDDWKFGGHIQLRSELDGRDFSNDTHPLTFASLRTRLSVEKSLFDKLTFFVQFQDSRVFGEEPSTLSAIDNIDLHQGYLFLNDLFGWGMDVQAGRFELVYGTERFFGAVGWHYIGRSWDGVRLKFNPGFKLDLFALTHTETVGYIGNAAPGTYPPSAPATPSYSIYGFWESSDLNQQNQLDLFGYYEVNRQKTGTGDLFLDRFSFGLNHFGNFNSLTTTFEGAYQFGSMGSLDISAYLLSLQVNYKLNEIKIGLGADILSGTGNSSEKYNTFSPSFGTNHKFYGYMDYFINIPSNTMHAGLNDFYFNFLILPEESKFSGEISLHHFTANKPVLITSGSEESSFGQEVDLTAKYNFIKGTTLTWGGSLFFPGEIMKSLFSSEERIREDIGFWTYVMITAAIN